MHKFCTYHSNRVRPWLVAQIGSARGYQELSAPLAIPTTAEQVGGQAVCLCIASAGRDARFCRIGRVRSDGIWPAVAGRFVRGTEGCPAATSRPDPGVGLRRAHSVPSRELYRSRAGRRRMQAPCWLPASSCSSSEPMPALMMDALAASGAPIIGTRADILVPSGRHWSCWSPMLDGAFERGEGGAVWVQSGR
jgi:hypothetical protein